MNKQFEKPATSVDPDQAWRALGLVNESLKHAEAKSATALAAAGVIGGVLFSLVAEQNDLGWLPSAAAVICAAAVLAAGTCAGVALWPRLLPKEPPTNRFYFDHIARQHPEAATYLDVLHQLAGSKDDIVRELAAEVWANAHISQKKFRWAGRAIAALIVSLGALATVALFLGIGSLSR